MPDDYDADHEDRCEPASEHEEHDGENRRKERRTPGRRPRGDRRILEALAAVAFDPDSSEWHELLTVLADYGYAVLRHWLVNGKIYHMARTRGRGVRGLTKIPSGLTVTGDDAHELAVMTVQSSLRRFLRSLEEGAWDPERGASLATFFVGRCLMVFPDVYEQWSRERSRWRQMTANSAEFDEGCQMFGGWGDDTAGEALARAEREYLLAPLPQDDRALLELSAVGYTVREIAEMFTRAGVPRTQAAVSARLHRLREQLRQQRHDDPRDEDPRGGGDGR